MNSLKVWLKREFSATDGLNFLAYLLAEELPKPIVFSDKEIRIQLIEVKLHTLGLNLAQLDVLANRGEKRFIRIAGHDVTIVFSVE